MSFQKFLVVLLCPELLLLINIYFSNAALDKVDFLLYGSLFIMHFFLLIMLFGKKHHSPTAMIGPALVVMFFMSIMIINLVYNHTGLYYLPAEEFGLFLRTYLILLFILVVTTLVSVYQSTKSVAEQRQQIISTQLLIYSLCWSVFLFFSAARSLEADFVFVLFLIYVVILRIVTFYCGTWLQRNEKTTDTVRVKLSGSVLVLPSIVFILCAPLVYLYSALFLVTLLNQL